MALIATQTVGITGTTVTYGAVTTTDTVNPDERTWLEVVNASGGSINCTIVVPGTTYGQPNPDVVVAVPAGQRRHIGPLPRGLANTSGLVDVLFSATASVTAAALRL